MRNKLIALAALLFAGGIGGMAQDVLAPDLSYITAGFGQDPYSWQVVRMQRELGSPMPARRAAAIEGLALMRACCASGSVAPLLHDSAMVVRRAAAGCLGVVGGRAQVPELLRVMAEDADWSVRQAAGAALANLSGLDLPWDALAPESIRAAQLVAWRDWWQKGGGRQPAPLWHLGMQGSRCSGARGVGR